MPDDHAAWQKVSGENYAELTQTSDFNFDDIDTALGLVEEAPPAARAQAGELVRQIFAYCFKSRQGKPNLKTAAAKLAAIGAGLRPDAFDDATQGELAAQLGLTKAALSKTSVKFQDAFGIKFARSRSKEARQRMAAKRLGGPDRHHHDTKEAAS
jgi:hypothetical protein